MKISDIQNRRNYWFIRRMRELFESKPKKEEVEEKIKEVIESVRDKHWTEGITEEDALLMGAGEGGSND